MVFSVRPVAVAVAMPRTLLPSANQTEEPALAEAVHDTLPFAEELVCRRHRPAVPTVILPSRSRVGRRPIAQSCVSLRRRKHRSGRFSNARPRERPGGPPQTPFLDKLVGALNERLNVLRRADGAGGDGLLCARHRRIGAENRRGGQEGEGNQETRQPMFHHWEN